MARRQETQGMHVRPARLIAALSLIATIGGSCTSATPASQPPETGTHSPTGVTTTPAPITSQSIAISPPTTTNSSRVVLVTSLHHVVAKLAPGEGVLYALVGSNNFGSMQVLRIDPASRTIKYGPKIDGAMDLALSGDSVWVTDGGGARRWLIRLDASSLSVQDRIELPTSPSDLIVGPAGVWVGAVGHLYLIDPSTGTLERTVPIHGEVGRLTIDVTDGLLYDSTHPVGDLSVDTLEERDGTTGELRVRSAADRGLLAMNSMSAVRDGVWVSFASGNMGGAALEGRADLHRLAPPHEGADIGTNAILASVAGGILWITPGEGVWCAGPQSGKVRAWVPFVRRTEQATTPVVELDGKFYAGALNQGTGASVGLVRIDPGNACGPVG